MTKINVKFNEVKNQYFAVFCVNLISCSHGALIGWLATALPTLQSDDSPLITGKVTTEQTSWIGACIAIGGMCGNLSFGLLSSKIGAKNTLYLIAFPNMTFWLIVIFAKYVEHLYIARIMAGLTGGGMFSCIPLFVSEIAHQEIRGTLMNLLSCAYTFGTLLSYILGTYLDYHILPYIMILLPIAYFCTLFFIPNSPQYYLQKNEIEKAEKSFMFYKNLKHTNKNKYNEDFAKLKATAVQRNQETTLQFSDFWEPKARKAILLAFGLMALNAFSGAYVLISYTVTIFDLSGSDIDPNTSTIIVGVTQFIGIYLSTTLVDKIGRKRLVTGTLCGACVGFTLFGIFSYLVKHDFDLHAFNWIPVLSLSFVIFIASVGFLPISLMLVAEVLPLKIRSIGLTLSMTTLSIYSFVTLKLFPTLSESIDIYGCMWAFGVICVLGIFLSVFFIKETKGTDINNIVVNNNNVEKDIVSKNINAK